MEHYDIAIISLGPAGATLARLLDSDLKVIALDKKQQKAEEGFQKPGGGLLAPDAQSFFVCGEGNAFLLGKAAGFISVSSLEGIRYALDSAEIRRNIFNEQHTTPNSAYLKRT